MWINASAIGIYGDRGDERLDETSAPGEGFLAETCVAWEAATGAARVAVGSAITSADDPARAAKELSKIVNKQLNGYESSKGE